MKYSILLVVMLVMVGCKETQTVERKSDKPNAPSAPSQAQVVEPNAVVHTATVIDGNGQPAARVISIDSNWGSYKVMGLDASFVADINPETGEYSGRDVRYSDANCLQDPTVSGGGPIGYVFASRDGNTHYRVTGKRTIQARSRRTAQGCEAIAQTKVVSVAEDTQEEVDVTSTDPATGFTSTRKVIRTTTVYHDEIEPVDTTVSGLAVQEIAVPYDFTQIAPLQLGL